ncbi:MAG TPA: hypothetical protein VHW05_13485 [Phenylobacterium sp.]|jgi:hypothetical protein|nr:hypothetical protein [Phenylobacterium sp.]
MRATSAILIAALALAVTSTGALAAKPAARAAAPVKAGSPTVTDDVRCLLTMVAFSNINKDHAQAAQAAVFFFAGRISARAPTLDLAAAVKAQAPTLGPQQLQGELQRCGPMVDGASHRFMAAVNGLRPQGAGAPAAALAPAPGPLAPPPK